MTQTELDNVQVGVEVSVLHEGRRRRGWIAEKDSEAVVRLYPDTGDKDFAIQKPRQLKVLKQQNIPQGWNAVDMTREDGTPWISLRFTDFFWENLHRQAEVNSKTPEQQMMDYVLSGVGRDESRAA